MTDEITLRLLDDYQRGFPLTPRPFARIADDLGITEAEVIDRLRALQHDGSVSRVGAVVRPNVIGASTLAAMAVPAQRLEAVAARVSALPEVNHNYEREHALNLWFVVTAADRAGVDAALARIGAETGLEVLEMPLEADYHIDLGFALS